MLENLKRGEVSFLQVIHDDCCPTIASWDNSECTCSSLTVRLHQNFAHFERDYNNARLKKRKARRAAERAMRKAAGKSPTKTKAARATGAASKGTPTVEQNCSTGLKKGGAA